MTKPRSAMMSTIMRFTVPALLAVAAAGSVTAQSRTEVACDDDWIGGDRRSIDICESRELALPPEELLEIDGGPNGSVRVTGWDRNEIQVRAKVRSWDSDEDAARDRLDEISIDTDGVLRARGPYVQNSWRFFGRRNGGWSVSFEIMAPYDTDLGIESVNGLIAVTDIRGDLDVEAVNGGISLTNVSASVRGRTVNGGIMAVLTDDTFEGDRFDVRTTNGGVVLRIPDDFSARLDIETVNGGVDSDFPVTREGRGNREVSGTLGTGGPLIRARTVNGGVQIRKL
jgi:Toastrack DUF4097